MYPAAGARHEPRDVGAPATQRNLAQVAQDGATVLGVGNGDQACGETGDGRMLEPSELLEEVIAFCPKVLAGQKC